MYEEEKLFRRVIVGAFIIVGSWKSYLVFRNTLMIRDMPYPPPELELSQGAYDQMQLITQHDIERLLLVIIIGVNIRVAKLVFNYFPYVWVLSGEYGSTLVSQTMWFAAIDNCSEVLVGIPIAILGTLLTGGNPLLSALDQMLEVAFRGILAAATTYVVIYASENFGASSIMEVQLVLNALGLLSMAIYLRFMMSLDHERLPNDETGRTVVALAKDVGYPTDTIYVDKRSPEPNAYYSYAIFSQVIIITESLLTSLDVQQVASVVAHELGHWKYHHPLYTFLEQTSHIVAMGCFWIFAYGSPRLIRVFHLDPEVHPFVPAYLSFYFLWPPFRDVTKGISNLVKTYFEFVADDYACSLWSAKNLRAALVKISTKMKSFPLLDGWFAAWFIGHPSILQRIRRIDANEGWKMVNE